MAVAEEHKFPVNEQSGFHTREEAPAQATTLFEIHKRRKNIGLNTYAAFLDLNKASHRVPHTKLLQCLQNNGFERKMLESLKETYRSPNSCVRASFGVSEKFSKEIGVTQGCSMSPILFDLFINDIFEKLQGIQVPGMTAKVPGL